MRSREARLVYMREYAKANPEKNRRATARWRTSHLAFAMWLAAKHRAKKSGAAFTIAVEDIVIPATCPVLGIPLVVGIREKGAHDDSPSLDKIVDALGYVPGNVAVISWRANRIKHTGSADEHRKIANWLDHFTGKALK